MTMTETRDNENKSDLSKTSCLFCQKMGNLIKNCLKRFRKEQEQKQYPTRNVKRFKPKTYSLCPHCQRTNHPSEIFWNYPNGASRPQNFKRHPPSSDNQESPKEGKFTLNPPPSNLKNHLNYQHHDSNGYM